MNAIILAAGRGSRMKTLTDEKPKCLVPFKGKPLLQWQLDALTEAGIASIGIVTGYRAESFDAFGLTTFYNERWDKTNMVSSLACAEEWLEKGPCIVSYSDIFYDANAVHALMESTADLAITYDPNWLSLWEKRFEDPLSDAETFRMTPDSYLTEIGNKPRSIEEIQGQYMGLLRFTPKGWHEIKQLRRSLSPDEQDSMHMTGTLQRVILGKRVPILAIPYNGKWGEIDSQEDLKAAEL